MRTGLQIIYLYHDADIVELEVGISNGRFSGSANLYVATGELAEIADLLADFPANSADTRDYTLGTFEPGGAGGAIRLNFYLRDLAGHASLRAFVKDDHPTSGHTQRGEIVLDIELAAFDHFVSDLRRIEEEQGSAYLFA